jgi:hypothetical protein
MSTIDFPPRNEPFDFRQRLEAIVWIQEYLRYRLNGCGHNEAVTRVLAQIDTGAIQPACGAEQTGDAIAFPPRNEPFTFRQALEVKYRDGLRRPAVSSFVDNEGDIVWTQEYIRYRVNGCGHLEAVQRVFLQLDNLGIQPTCAAGTAIPNYAGSWVGRLLVTGCTFSSGCRVGSTFEFELILMQAASAIQGRIVRLTPVDISLTGVIAPNGSLTLSNREVAPNGAITSFVFETTIAGNMMSGTGVLSITVGASVGTERYTLQGVTRR